MCCPYLVMGSLVYLFCVGIGDLGIACELPTWVYDAVMPWWSVWKPCSFCGSEASAAGVRTKAA